jgi:uncharacterized protein YbaR (Trm112 family)
MSHPGRPTDLFDLLACPVCKTPVARLNGQLACTSCRRRYPILDGVPVLFADGRIPEYQHQQDLQVRRGYLPWIERLVVQSLPPGAIMLDLGAGNRAVNLPQVIRMDVTRTPFVDVVGDAQALPFLPGAFDFIFSLAVMEHLPQPFAAAREMAAALRPGGYVYGECNFVFPYHGFPHHYFNATQQGLEEVFAPFRKLRSGVAPYQMPSFAVRALLGEYRRALERLAPDRTASLRDLLEQVCSQPLQTVDGWFPEGEAVRLAAGVFFFGVKTTSGPSEVVPAAVQEAWRQSPDLQQAFPDPLDLGHAPNLLLWARSGREHDPAIRRWFEEARMFRKRADVDDTDWRALLAEPIVEPRFGHIPEAADDARAGAPRSHRPHPRRFRWLTRFTGREPRQGRPDRGS